MYFYTETEIDSGFHVYFYTETEIDSAKLIAARNPLVEHVDRRGLSGLIFAPGCAFDNPGHDGKPYTIALDQPIINITDLQFWSIWDAFAMTRHEAENGSAAVAKLKREKATVRKAKAAGRQQDVPPSTRPLPNESALTKAFPPCVAVLLWCCAQGLHLYHAERVFLASFMVADGWDPEEVVMPLFKRMPDFDEVETAKQVSHIARKGYKPAGCRRLKVMGMCPATSASRSPYCCKSQ